MSTTENETVGIAQAINRAMQDAGYGSYAGYARPVVEALTARENDIVDKLVDYAVDAGADQDEVVAYLREIGMAVPTREPEVEVDDEDEDSVLARIDERLSTLAATVESLSQFARANGYRG